MPDYIVTFSSGYYRVFNVANLEKHYFIVTTERLISTAIWRGSDYRIGLNFASEANRKHKREINRRGEKLIPRKAERQEKLL